MGLLQAAGGAGVQGHRDLHQLAARKLPRRGPQARRHERQQLRRLHHGLLHDAHQALRRGHRRCAGHGLAQLRFDLHRALHATAQGQPRRLRGGFRDQGGQEPERPPAPGARHER